MAGRGNRRRGSGEDVSAILYTSGTTGRPKGVLLSAERSVRAAQSTVAFDRLTESDEVLAYLPLAWVGDHYMTYAQGLVAGWCIACPESVETVQENCGRSVRHSISLRRACSRTC